jgi:chemotaxis signal transduction protein
VKTDFILGMGKIGDRVKILLDIDKVLAREELAHLANS